MASGERIKQLREEHGLTQQKAAEIFKVSKSSYVKYERNEREPHISTLVMMANYFNVTLDYLSGISDERNRVLYEIGNIKDFILSDEYAMTSGKYLLVLQELAGQLIRIIYDSDSQRMWDILYLLVQLGACMSHLSYAGEFIHAEYSKDSIFYEKEVDRDTFYKDQVMRMEYFSENFHKAQTMFSEFLLQLASHDYYSSGTFFYKKEFDEMCRTLNKESKQQ